MTARARPAVFVDYNLYLSSPELRHWLKNHERDATYVLLVSPAEKSLKTEVQEQFEVVIQNSGKTSEIAFKLNALKIVRDMSNLLPVLAFDADVLMNAFYEENGILIASDK